VQVLKVKGTVPKFVPPPTLLAQANRFLTAIPRGESTHKFGITHLSFYPFDNDAFLSSSYDHTLKLYSTETLSVSASFNLDSIIYTHALSPIATHLLVACCTQHPSLRLVDLRSGASSHSLPGHHGALLACAWSPTKEHILASAATDGSARVWDVRKSSATLAVLDMEDSIGVGGLGGAVKMRESAKAHNGAVNGLSWTDDGEYIVTAGHDNKIRVWNSSSGANTLASFGPTIKNGHLSNIELLITPTALMKPREEILFYPNEHELLMFELHEGKLLKRLKVPGPSTAAVRSRTGERNTRNRITSLVWRGAVEGVLSGHADGNVRAWAPEVEDEEEEEMGEEEREREEEVMKKRKAMEDIFRDLTKKKITFG
jgi:DNA excision repair protein ERCC-8